MDAFESLVAMLLRKEGYWTAQNVKVNLSPDDKRLIKLPTTPRWEIDVVAYKGATDEILAVECKSLLDSTGVIFRNGSFEPDRRYKLFTDNLTRKVVLRRLRRQLVKVKSCRATPRPKVILCLAAGHIAKKTDREAMEDHFRKHRWRLFDESWIFDRLVQTRDAGYENDIAHVVTKLLHAKGIKTP